MERDIVGNWSLLFKRALNRLGKPFGVNPFPRSFSAALILAGNDRKGVFEGIYKQNLWGSDQSRSGVGSEAQFAMRYGKSLASVVKERSIDSIFDAPCGDLNWMEHFLDKLEIDYIGGDISPSVIAGILSRRPGLDVRQFDICEDVFPKVGVWHCRDCFFHLPFLDIKKAVIQFVNSDIPFALLTTHRARILHRNLDVDTGGFRYLDLERPPFSLPAALQYLPDYRRGKEFPRYVGLWKRPDLERAVAKWNFE